MPEELLESKEITALERKVLSIIKHKTVAVQRLRTMNKYIDYVDWCFKWRVPVEINEEEFILLKGWLEE